MRLEGTLNQIQLQWPRRMMDLEAQQHLKDCLFDEIRKQIHNSVQYLHSSPGTLYSQLMVATQKVKSESEETWERVRARAMVTTNAEVGMAKLGKQTAQLMAALTQTRQGNSHNSAPGSPQECGHR